MRGSPVLDVHGLRLLTPITIKPVVAAHKRLHLATVHLVLIMIPRTYILVSPTKK